MLPFISIEMIAAMMDLDDYWKTRCVGEAIDQGYTFLRLTCGCGRITDTHSPYCYSVRGSVGIASSAIFDFGVRVAEVRKSR